MMRFIAALLVMLSANVALAQSQYQARSGDTLVIEVLEDASLNRSVIILPDGRFSFPFAGTVQGAGRTVAEIQSSLSAAISPNFAAPPTVFVSIQPDNSRRVSSGGGTKSAGRTIDVYFMGEVSSPGLKELSAGTTLLQALAQSGGLTKFAATKRIQLRRQADQSVVLFNYKAVSQGAVLTASPVLRDGDVILVPTRRLFE